MTDQEVAARMAAIENTLNRTLGLLCERGALNTEDVKAIRSSVDDLERHGVKATAPGAAHLSAAVADIIRKTRQRVSDLPTR